MRATPAPEVNRRQIRPNTPPFPTLWPENPAPRGPRPWRRSQWSAVGVAKHGRDRRERHASGDGRDAEAMPETLWTSLRAVDAGTGHDPGDLPVCGRPEPRPEGPAGGLRRCRAERVDELKGAEQCGRDWDLTPVLDAALQGPDPDRGGSRSTSLGQLPRLRKPSAGVGERQRKSLVGRQRHPGRRRAGDRGSSETFRVA